MRVPTETIIPLPWLAPFDAIMQKHGYGDILNQATAPAGSDVAIDEASRRVRILYPDGRTLAWSDLAELKVDPDEPSWSVNWRVTGTLDAIVLGFEPFDGDEEEAGDALTAAQVYSDGFEGQESLFADFVRLLRDPMLNPHGFDLPDGIYCQSGTSVRFDVHFGGEAGIPLFRALPETLPAELLYPYVTDICVHEPLAFQSSRHGRVEIAAGFYRTKVTSFNTRSGEVLTIQCKSMGDAPAFKIDGETLTRFLHEESVDIMKIITDRRPSY